jgi:hypothetical protein
MAETLNEAAVLGVKTMNVPDERLYLLSLDALAKAPQVYHSISGASLKCVVCTAGQDSEGTGFEIQT